MLSNPTEFDFSRIRLLKTIIDRNPQSQFLSTFKEVFGDIKEILANRIPKVFDQYTVHDVGHSIRIMENMYDLITDVSILDELEIIVLCYSALLHDVGMAVSDSEIDDIISNRYIIDGYKFSAFLKLNNGNKELAISEFVRKFHAKRSKEYILKELSDKYQFPNRPSLNFWEEIGLICQSHNESINWIFDNLPEYAVRQGQTFNPRYCACLLRLGDILDIDDQRTPYQLFKFINPSSFSKSEWLQHYSIFNYDKIITDEIGTKTISLFGRCDDPKIHRKLLSYFDWVSFEVKECIRITKNMSSKYLLRLNDNLSINIETEGYSFPDKKLTVDFKAVTSLLTGEKIYGDKKNGLRELIQNGLDACRIRTEEEIRSGNFEGYVNPMVDIRLNKIKNYVIIKDNGIGMNLDTIKNHFLNIGSSYYKSSDFILKGYTFNPIGNFGIGFLACFMLSPTVKVITKHIRSTIQYTIDIEKNSEYTSIAEKDGFSFWGTEIHLEYTSFSEVFEGTLLVEVKKFLEENFINNGVEIKVTDEDIKPKISSNGMIQYFSSPVYNNLEQKFSELHSGNFLRIQKEFNLIEGYVKYFQKPAHFIENFQTLFVKLENLFTDWHIYDFFYFDDILIDLFLLNNESLPIESFLDGFKLSFFIITLSPVTEYSAENSVNTFKQRKAFTDLEQLGGVVIFYKVNQISSIFRSQFVKTMPDENVFVESFLRKSFKNILYRKFGNFDDVKLKSLHLFKSEKSSKYILVDIISNLGKLDDGSLNVTNPLNSTVRQIYLKNVLVKNSNFRFDIQIPGIIIDSYRLNISGDDVYTTVSRDKFDKNSLLNIYVIYLKEIYRQIIMNLYLDKSSKHILLDLTDFLFRNTYLDNL